MSNWPVEIKGMVPTLTGTHAVMIDPENGHYGWVFFKHADGGWVSSRKASEAEMQAAERQDAMLRTFNASEFANSPPPGFRRLADGASEKIEQLAQTNPIVRDCIQMQRNPGVLYVDALEMAVIALAEQHAAALAELATIRLRGLPPTVIVTSQEQADQIHARYVQGETNHPAS